MERLSDYRVSLLKSVPLMFFGEAYSVVTATQLNADVFLAESFLILQRPDPKLYLETLRIDLTNFPQDEARWTLEDVLEHATSQVNSMTDKLLDDRISELKLPNHTICQFEFKPFGASLLGPWLRGSMRQQILELREKTQCPKLKVFLKCFESVKFEKLN